MKNVITIRESTLRQMNLNQSEINLLLKMKLDERKKLQKLAKKIKIVPEQVRIYNPSI